MDFDTLLRIGPYALPREEKAALYTARMTQLTRLHSLRCPPYARLLRALGRREDETYTAQTVPMLPVSLFKELKLRSIPEEDIFKTITSSGTSGQAVSKIYLDAQTAANQQRVLYHIVSDFIGKNRLAVLIIDSLDVLRDRNKFSARGAGLLGFSMFASKTCYALNEKMQLRLDEVRRFLEQHEGEPVLLFGFTYIIWKYFVQALRARGERLNLPQGTLIHGGGWKKLLAEAVAPQTFKAQVRETLGLTAVSDYYGMAEQTGCIAMECPCGHLHASIWSDIYIRRPEDFSLCKVGEPGMVETLSLLPESYPGHALLTEDMGVLLGEDDCPCGRLGKYFAITGRIPRAEIRGCSDTYEN